MVSWKPIGSGKWYRLPMSGWCVEPNTCGQAHGRECSLVCVSEEAIDSPKGTGVNPRLVVVRGSGVSLKDGGPG